MIRLASHHDIEQLVEMRWDFTLEDHPSVSNDHKQPFNEECRSFLDEALSGKRWYIWVAEVDHRIVSHIYVQLIDKVPRPGRVTHPFGYVTNVYTRPDYRKKEIGSKLNAAVEQWAKERGVEFLLVWPSTTSIAFYTRNGYEASTESMELHW